MDHPKKKICRICNKRYSSGKALGGHMRSHFAKHPLPPPLKQKQPGTISSTSVSISPSSSSSLVNLRKNDLSPEPSAVEHVTMASTESESDQYSRKSHATRRRSKRCRRSVNSSVSEKTLISAEDAALFLVMLSRDKWEDAASDDKRKVQQPAELAKFRCETCNKQFSSYQALGGHKANHSKMMKNGVSDDDDEEEEEIYESIKEEGNEGGKYNYVVVCNDPPIRSFPCPFCPKSFRSGQALGGHKKVHFSNTLPIRARIGRKFEDSLIIDLNLPAIGDDEVE